MDNNNTTEERTEAQRAADEARERAYWAEQARCTCPVTMQDWFWQSIREPVTCPVHG